MGTEMSAEMSTIPATMRAAVLTAPGIENLAVTDLPVPQP